MPTTIRRLRRTLACAVAPTVIAATIAASCGGGAPAPSAQANEPARQPELREVRTAAAREERWPRTLFAYGSLAADERATLSAKVPGRASKIAVDLGTPVRAGDLVAEIDRKDYELRLKNAEAAVQQARARLGLPLEGDDDRVDIESSATVRQAQALLDEVKKSRARLQGLREGGVSSQSEVDAVEAQYLVAQSRLQDAREEMQNRIALAIQRRSELVIARQQLLDTRIVAPFDGVVLERRAGHGDYLLPGAPVATIVRIDPLRLRAEVSEREAPLVRLGQTVRFYVEGDPTVYAATLTRTSPVIAEQNRMLLVEAVVPNPSAQRVGAAAHGDGMLASDGNASGSEDARAPRDAATPDDPTSLSAASDPFAAGGGLRPGAFARVEIVVDEDARTVVVPREALASFAGIDRVIVIVDGKATERRVVVGRRAEDKVEILSGLAAGDEVVLAPGDLQSGAPVRVAR